MASRDVIQKTNELTASLKMLHEEAKTGSSSLGNLTKIIRNLSENKIDVTSIKEATLMLASFRKNLQALTGDSAKISSLTKEFIALADAVERARVNTALGRISRSNTRVNKLFKEADEAPGLPNLAGLVKENAIYESELKRVEAIKGYLNKGEQYWREALEKADAIQKLKAEVMRKLVITETGGLFNLPPGTPTTGFPAMPPLALGAGNIPPRYPLLPPGNIKSKPPELISGPVGPTTQYGPPINLPPAVIQAPPPTSYPALPAFVEVRKAVDTFATDYANQTAESIKAAGQRTSPEDTGVGKKVTDRTRETLKQARKDIPIYETEQVISPESLRSIGLSGTAAANLSKTLEELGMKQARVTSASTELSTGIKTISFEAQAAGGAVNTFTAHVNKYGTVLQDTQKRFRGFGSAVMRDIVEVMKWTIAITAIYTPIRKIGEMMEEMKKIQLDLVDVQIVLGNSTRDLNTVLDASAKIATETSSTWEGVIEGYSLAAAATASAKTEMERVVTTETLLKDSMILSKLANIDQKQALDTLVGSLSQLGMGLSQGTQLLDSWVAVSKKANVSVKDMATSFTIVGSAAEEVGLTYNELNALIGGLAQSTNLSSDELGNAIRGIISTMQTDKAQQEFAKYGIATKTFSNDLRDLMLILNEMKVMSQTGILDEKAMGALTQAGGGGARRGAQLSALVQNLSRVMELVTISEQASGDAAKAMELEMSTLDAATTRLNNSFSMLAVTLGTEGGILPTLTKITDGLSFLISKLRDLTSVLKGAAPLLAGFLLAKGIAKTPQGAGMLDKPISGWLSSLFMSPSAALVEGEKVTGGTKLPRILNRLFGKVQARNIGVTGIEGTPMNLPGGGYMNYTGVGVSPSGYKDRYTERATWGQFGKGLSSILSKQFLGNLSMANLAGPTMIAMSNIGQEGGLARGGAAAAGGVLMAAITGSPLWATVGATIATAFYDKFLTFEGDIASSWTKYAKDVLKPPPEELEDSTSILERINSEMESSLTPFQNFVTTLGVYSNEIVRMTSGIVTPEAAAITPMLTGKQARGGETLGKAEMILAYATMGEKDLGVFKDLFTDEQKEKIRDMVRRWTSKMVEQGILTGEIPLTPVQEQAQAEMDAVAQYAATASAAMMKEAISAISTGAEGAIPAYMEIQDAATQLSSTAAKLITAQKGLATDVNEFLGTEIPQMEGVVAAPEYKPFTPQEAVTYLQGLAPDERQATITAYGEITDLLDNIYNLNAAIEDQAGGATPMQIQQMEEYKNQLLLLGQTFPTVLGALEKSSTTSLFKEQIKEFIELPLLTDEQISKVKVEAEKQWADWFKAQEATPEQIEAYKNSLIAMKLKIGEDFTGLETIIPQEFWQGAVEKLGVGQPASITEMRDVTTSQLNAMMMQYPMLIKQIEAVFKNAGMTWTPNEQDYLALTKDGYSTIHADLSLLALLQQDLIDETKKQGLQGIYNLPAGATFMVPVSAYELDQATRSEMASSSSASASILQSILDLLSNTLPKITGEETPQAENARNRMETRPWMERVNRAEARNPDNQVSTKSQTSLDAAIQEFSDAIKRATGLTPAERIAREYEESPIKTKQPFEVTPATPTQPNWAMPDWLSRFLDIFKAQPSPMGMNQESNEAPAWLRPLVSQQISPLSYTPMAQAEMAQPQPPVTTALNLEMTSNIQLMVDGRTLATVIKPYLYQDLIRYMTSANSTINRSVVG